MDIETPKQLSRDKMRGNVFENFGVMEIYTKHFKKTLRELPQWINTSVVRMSVVCDGDFENKVGEVKMVNNKKLRF